MPSATWTIPEPPSTNRMWRNNRNGKKPYPARQYLEWRDEALWEIRRQGLALFGSYAVRLTIELPKSCRKDADNTVKPIGDMLQAGHIVVNDKQIRDVRVFKGDGVECRITVETLGELGTQCDMPSSPPR